MINSSLYFLGGFATALLIDSEKTMIFIDDCNDINHVHFYSLQSAFASIITVNSYNNFA